MKIKVPKPPSNRQLMRIQMRHDGYFNQPGYREAKSAAAKASFAGLGLMLIIASGFFPLFFVGWVAYHIVKHLRNESKANHDAELEKAWEKWNDAHESIWS